MMMMMRGGLTQYRDSRYNDDFDDDDDMWAETE